MRIRVRGQQGPVALPLHEASEPGLRGDSSEQVRRRRQGGIVAGRGSVVPRCPVNVEQGARQWPLNPVGQGDTASTDGDNQGYPRVGPGEWLRAGRARPHPGQRHRGLRTGARPEHPAFTWPGPKHCGAPAWGRRGSAAPAIRGVRRRELMYVQGRVTAGRRYHDGVGPGTGRKPLPRSGKGFPRVRVPRARAATRRLIPSRGAPAVAAALGTPQRRCRDQSIRGCHASWRARSSILGSSSHPRR